MVALSLSRVTSDCSSDTVSPGATSTSMTVTSSKSPISGTFSSMVSAMSYPFVLARLSLPMRMPSDVCWIGLGRVDAIFFDGCRDLGGGELVIVGQGLKRGNGDEITIDLKEGTQGFT